MATDHGMNNRRWFISSAGNGMGYRVNGPLGVYLDMGWSFHDVPEYLLESFHDTWYEALKFMWRHDPRVSVKYPTTYVYWRLLQVNRTRSRLRRV